MNHAQIIQQQIGVGSLMSLGAHDLAAVTEKGQIHGFTFMARILPFTKAGKRSSAARNMRVMIMLNELDYYDVSVTYARKYEGVTHYEGHNVGAEQISNLMLALDYDGDTALNPRLI